MYIHCKHSDQYTYEQIRFNGLFPFVDSHEKTKGISSHIKSVQQEVRTGIVP